MTVILAAVASLVAQPEGESPPPDTVTRGEGVRSGAGEEDFTTHLDWAQVRFVEAVETAANVWRFSVTVEHNDEGWDHYADAWQVVDPETLEVYGERVLLHPHDNEQPFTRSESGVRIPEGVEAVLVRARCNAHDWSGQAVVVPLAGGESDLYTVEGR